MKLVGLGGGIGAGKSSVSTRLAQRGAVIVDADVIARQIVEPGRPALEAIFERFGLSVRREDGALDRAALAAIVFADPAALSDLNGITHPAIRAEMGRLIAAERDTNNIVVMDAALLFEPVSDATVRWIVVDVDPSIAVARLVQFRGFSEADAWARLATQMSREDRLAMADFVLDNSGDEAALEAEVDRAWAWIQTLLAAALSPPPMKPFKVHSDFAPAGDQPEAIAALTKGINRGDRFQTLLGITGSGKSATIAWTIEQVQRPTLVLAPNKSLAAQLANEFREFFPENRVEYFVSYYDYYQPEAYLPSSDTYIEKDSSINDEIDRLRHSATSGLLTRRDTIVVASVSCIYGMGNPEEYRGQLLELHAGVDYDQRWVLRRLVDMQYDRNDANLVRGNFRVRGDTIEVHPAYEEHVLRIEMFGDTVERICTVDPVTGEQFGELPEVLIFPATHYVAGEERMQRAIGTIQEELQHRLKWFETEGKLLEAQRLRMRTQYDLEMMQEVGYCNGIENYSRHIDGRSPGEAPFTLIDYFPKDFLLVIDESHIAVPQVHGQFMGDRSRKETLVDHGFRLPSAADNRPLRWDEFYDHIHQLVFVSATPSKYEIEQSTQVVEQVVRPTGLLDPEISVRPTKGQIDDLMAEARKRIGRGDRVLVTTLTKRMAQDLSDYLLEQGLRVRYLHSEIDTIERIEILRDLRLGEFDVLVGINLLREGLDLPEVSLVCILDADKEGFLRSETSLIQTMGRASRNVDGQVIMYADRITGSMERAIAITEARRKKQIAYNTEHGINPETIRKAVTDILAMLRPEEAAQRATVPGSDRRKRRPGEIRTDLRELPKGELERLIRTLEEEMSDAARDLRFEYAARLRDEINDLKKELFDKPKE